MSKKEMVGGVPGNILGMLADVMHKLQHGSITPEELEKFSKRKNPFKTPDFITIKERNLETSEILNLCRAKFPVLSYYSDEDLDKMFPIPEVLTERKFKNNIEADEENKNKSANDLGIKGLSRGITLRERLIMELEYFERTSKHLDIKNITLCTGSRYSDCSVPCVYWYGDDGELSVSGYHSGDARGYLRSRLA